MVVSVGNLQYSAPGSMPFPIDFHFAFFGQIAEILKDRPSWFRDCRSLEVFTMFPAGNGGTIELIYTQVNYNDWSFSECLF